MGLSAEGKGLQGKGLRAVRTDRAEPDRRL